MTRITRPLQVWGILTILLGPAAAAQERPVLEPADYAQWESIGVAALSPDGRWLAYTIDRVDDDGELRIREVGRDTTYVVAHGARPSFSSDGRWLAYAIGHSEEARDSLQKAGTPLPAREQTRLRPPCLAR